MRSNLNAFNLVRESNFQELLKRLQQEPGVWQPLAGGTDVMVFLNAGKLTHKNFVDITTIAELQGIRVTPAHIEIGALVTYSETLDHELLQKEFPNLCHAARETGAPAIQNRGTLGGNVANASPIADSPPALLSYEAEVEVISTRGSRSIPYHAFHKSYKVTELAPDEIIRAVRLPRQSQDRVHFYRKVGTRRAQSISKTCLSLCLKRTSSKIESIAIGLGGVGAIPLRAAHTETLLTGKNPQSVVEDDVRLAIRKDCTPISDMRSTAEYRLGVTQNLLIDFLKKL